MSASFIVWGAEAFAEHLGAASVRLGVSAFALELLLAGAEPEELATVVVASIRGSPGVALGDVIGANVAICLVALGAGAVIAPCRSGQASCARRLLDFPSVRSLPGSRGAFTRLEGAILVGLHIIYVGAIWVIERRPPALSEMHELEDAEEQPIFPARRSAECECKSLHAWTQKFDLKLSISDWVGLSDQLIQG